MPWIFIATIFQFEGDYNMQTIKVIKEIAKKMLSTEFEIQEIPQFHQSHGS